MKGYITFAQHVAATEVVLLEKLGKNEVTPRLPSSFSSKNQPTPQG
jgi:hypothetical protein